MKYLISNTAVYRVDSEAEAKALIEEVKGSAYGFLDKYMSVHRDQKSKGEIIQEWYKVTLVQKFNDEKEPEDTIDINFERKGAF